VMSGSNEAIARPQEELEQAQRLLQQVSDLTTTESLKVLIADLESRLSDKTGLKGEHHKPSYRSVIPYVQLSR
jgi:hypothetical protein